MEERDDYPIIPLSENKTDGELLEEALIHIDKLNEELASLKEVVKELIPIANATFKSMVRHEVLFIPNKVTKDQVEAIIERAKRLSDNK